MINTRVLPKLIDLFGVIIHSFPVKCKFINHRLQRICYSDSLSNSSEKRNFNEADNNNAKNLIDKYGDHILRLAYSYLHNISDSEDILQETLIKYLVKDPTFQSDDHEKAWLFRVAINLSKNRLIYNKIRRTDVLSDTLACDSEDELKTIWEAVKKLPNKYREIIHLFYYVGYSTVEIADILDKKESTVRSLLRRGRMILKENLEEGDSFEEHLQ